MENPLLTGADNAIGATLNPTFPTGPANIIVPQIDVGHGLSGSATDNSLLAASSLQVSGKGENSATNLTSSNSQTGQSGIDRLTGLPAMPGRSAKAMSSGDGGSSGGSTTSSGGSGGSSGGTT